MRAADGHPGRRTGAVSRRRDRAVEAPNPRALLGEGAQVLDAGWPSTPACARGRSRRCGASARQGRADRGHVRAAPGLMTVQHRHQAAALCGSPTRSCLRRRRRTPSARPSPILTGRQSGRGAASASLRARPPVLPSTHAEGRECVLAGRASPSPGRTAETPSRVWPWEQSIRGCRAPLASSDLARMLLRD